MSSSFWLLAVESCDLPQAKKDITAPKAKQIHKMTTILTQNGPKNVVLNENGHFVNLLSFANSYFFLSLINIT